ncbi:hypothetical protein CYMTET_36176, partial [Cymbomonas tetramitiformis]
GAADVEDLQLRTLFVRKLPVAATPFMLREKMKQFGQVQGCRLVKDKATGRFSGTGFVELATVAQAEAAVAHCSKPAHIGGGIMVAGELIVLNMSLSKEGAQKLAAEQGTKQKHDKRNLYLAKEGVIEPDTPAAENVSKIDMDRRSRLQQEKASKLRSPNFFLSDTRLSVHNLPAWMDGKKLRELFVEAVKKKATKQTPVVLQSKVLMEADRKTADSKPKSKGMGFIEFQEHQHAL